MVSVVNNATIKNENLTNSFVLRDKGLEKLDNSLIKRDEVAEGEKYVEEKPLISPSKKTNFLRVPSKQISPVVDTSNYQIDVKSINVRAANEKKDGSQILPNRFD